MRRACQESKSCRTGAAAREFGLHRLRGRAALSALAVLVPFAVVNASGIQFTEEFTDGSSGWFDAAGSAALSWEASGGPDGSSFSFTGFNFVGSAPDDTTVLFRAQDEFDSSGGAFEGNWISDGVAEFSAVVRHDAGIPLTFFTRFASPFNFPGAIAIEFAPVPSDSWTLISFAIEPDSPQFVSFEGTDFETVFRNIGHVQIGVSVPEGLAGVDQQFTFSIDKPTIVPEPGTMILLGAGMLCASVTRRRARKAKRRVSSPRSEVASASFVGRQLGEAGA